MARKKPSFISPSGRVIHHLYRKYKRCKQHECITEDLPSLLDLPLVKNVPESEPAAVLNIDYFRSKCDLQNPRCVEHINSVESGMRKVVGSIIIAPREATTIADGIRTDLMRVLKSRGYHGILHLYGSYFTGLCSVDSDVDIIFEFHRHDSGTTPKDIPFSFEKILNAFPGKFSGVKLISNTRVPFIRFVHNGSGKECNITFENKMGIQNSKLIKLYLTLNPNLKTLTLYLKHLLNKYGIRGIGRITTHILFWMVVFFMQQKGLLPAVLTLRKACSLQNVISCTNCAVPDSYTYHSSKGRSVSLYSLLLDFAAFYRDFKFMKYVMSPHFGKAYPIDNVESLKGEGSSRSFATSFINLQHPSDLEVNLAKQTRKLTVNGFKTLCCHISKILPHHMKFAKESNRTLDDILPDVLPYIINQPDELVQSTSLQLSKLDSKRLTGRVIRSVRKLMENVLDFEGTKIVKKDISKTVGGIGETNVPTVYFSYSSTTETWNNKYISHILPHPRLNKRGEPYRQINVFFVCEIIAEKNIVKIMIESEAHLMTFLDEYARTLLSNIFKMTV